MSRRNRKQIKQNARRRAGTILTAVICFAVASLAVAGRASTPSSGTLSTANPVVTYTAGPLVGANVTPQAGAAGLDPVCTDATPCDDFQLTVDAPAEYVGKYNVKVEVRWANAASDFDVYVLDSAGKVVDRDAGSANPEVVVLPVQAGVTRYTVRTVIFASAGDTINARINFEPIPPPQTPGTSPLQFANFAAPPGVADDAGEPSIGVNWKTGKVMYYGGFLEYVLRVTFDDSRLPTRATWEKKQLFLAATPRALLDPILVTDRDTGRTFISQLQGGTKQNTMDITDDDGDTLQPSVGSGISSGVDHQTLGAGRFAPNGMGIGPTTAYPNAVYYCAQDVADANCAISLDGGVTFGPAVPIYTAAECGGLHGHLKVSRVDGTAYIPNKSCGGEQAVVLSEDNGLTWEVRKIKGTTSGEWDPSVGIADDGTLYFGYEGADGEPHMTVSRDKGLTWSKPYNVGAQLGIKAAVFPAVVAGDPDRAALAFIGTTTDGNYDTNAFNGTWNLYVSSTTDGGQTWATVNATPNDPVQRGRICTGGTGCALPGGGGDTRNLLDFFDATIDERGRVLVGYADGCVSAGCVAGDKNGDGKIDTLDNDFTAKGTIARQSGGPRMFAKYDTTGPVNFAPEARDDSAATVENTPVTVPVLANDSDPNGDPVALVGTTQGANGAVTSDGGAVTYRPNAGFYGDDQFTYTVSDPAGLTATARVLVTVYPFCPRLPTGGFSDTLEPSAKPGWSVDTAANNLGNVVSPNWQVVTDHRARSASHSWFSDAKTLDVKDDRLVTSVFAPSATTKLTFWHRYQFENGFDGGALEITTDGGATWKDVGKAAFAEGGYNGVISASYGNPIAGRDAWTGGAATAINSAMTKVVVNLGQYAGKNVRLRFRLGADKLLVGSLPGGGWWIDDIEITETLEVSSCNKPPIAADDTASTMGGTPVTVEVLSNDSDPDGDALTVSGVGQPANGSAATDGRTVTYTPAGNFVGQDGFTYAVSDGKGNTSTGRVTIHVSERPNTQPNAADDTASTQEGSPVVINVLANDSDPDGDTVSVASVSDPAHGSVSDNHDGTVTYTPDRGFSGSDSFTYGVSDGRGGTDTATVSVTVTQAPNSAPEAADDAAVTQENTAVTVAVLANDTDANGDQLSVTAVTQGAHGSVARNADQTVTYTPASGFSGSDTFTYTAGDGRGGADTATVTVIVESAQTSGTKSTGNGWIQGGGRLNFAFNAHAQNGVAKGRVSCDGAFVLKGTVQTLRVIGGLAEITGTGTTADDRPVRFVVRAEDNGAGGAGTDRFTVEVFDATGLPVYRASGVLEGGNIKNR